MMSVIVYDYEVSPVTSEYSVSVINLLSARKLRHKNAIGGAKKCDAK